jgi:ferrochelatase
VLCPIGFICDHVEVLYDLDVEAAATAGRLGLPIVRASTVNADEEFVSALAESVCAVVDRHRRGRPLPITR